MAKHSAGILMYRRFNGDLELLLVHPGGPFWANKDSGSWSLPKGEYEPDNEDALTVARRELEEETGVSVRGDFHPLHPLKQPSGKVIHAWALEGDCDAREIRSNKFSMEWPPRSGKQQEFPEVDRAEWFRVEVAKTKILRGQAGFLEQVEQLLGLCSKPTGASVVESGAELRRGTDGHGQQTLFD